MARPASDAPSGTGPLPAGEPANRLLSGLHVIECASFVAGPTGGMTLAQLGADVVRIDPLGGNNDHQRWPVAPSGTSYYWACLNKGKRSITVDMRSGEGRELVLDLATAPGSDRGILIDNVVGRSWMAPERLRQRRGDLVHLRIQGYPDGKPAVDYTVNAEVGIPLMTGPEGMSAPVNHVLPAWDLLTGLTVATGVLAAVHDRSRTGRGAYLELALLDVALAGVANLGWLAEAAELGAQRPRQGNHVFGSFGIDVGCRGGERIMVVALTAGQWAALQRATGTAAVFTALAQALDADLDDEAERYRFREAIAAIIRPWFAARDVEQVRKDLDAARVLWARYRQMPDVVADYRGGRHRVLADFRLPSGEWAITARSPLRLDGNHGPAGRAPELGRDTGQVLAEVLGLTTAEIGRLRDRRVIGPVAPGEASDLDHQ